MSTDSPKSTAMTYEIGNNNDTRKTDNKSFNNSINMKIQHCQPNLNRFTDENMNKPQSNQLDSHMSPTEQMHPEIKNNGCNT